MPPDLQVLVGHFYRGVYNITTHGYSEMQNDGITVSLLEATLGVDEPEVIEDYPHDQWGPCCLILAWTPTQVPLHAVIGYGGDIPDVITVYSPPDTEVWEEDFRTRRYQNP